MRFLADMGISPRVVADLARSGHDSIHLHAEGLGKLPDSKILEKAHRERRIVLTHDLDFGDLLAASGAPFPSVIIFRLKNMRPNNVMHYMRVILEQYSEALEQGAIISVNERRARVRTLPIAK